MRLPRGVSTMLLAVFGGACGISGPERSAPTHFSRTYAVVHCFGSTGDPPPCRNDGRASGADFVDSGRVTFRDDGSLTWMFARHYYTCPCYLGGCSTPCSDGPSIVNTTTGSYDLLADSINIELAAPERYGTKIRLLAQMPRLVTSDWAGPDSVSYSLGYGGAVYYTK